MYRKLSLLLALFATISVGCTNTKSNFGDLSSRSKASGLVDFIVIADELTLGEVHNEISNKGGQVVRRFEFKNGLVTQIPVAALAGLRNKFTNAEFIEDIAVNLVDPVAAMGKPSGGGTTQPSQILPWGIQAIGADQAYALNRGSGVTVCVVDTGIDKTHPDLDANVVGGRNFIVSKGKIDPRKWIDDNGHGSHVAGTIAAEDNDIGSIGVAPEASLYAVKVLDSRGSGSISGVIDGINECTQAGVSVINMSLGATASPTGSAGLLMQAAVDAARNVGIEVVVAAGNEGQDIGNVIPAGLNNVIAVSAVDVNLSFPSWSNFGLMAGDFAAPGVSIFSTWKSGSYNTISGTSMASPHVAGVAALRIASGKGSYSSIDFGAPVSRQGSGLIDALGTVQN